MLLSLPIPLGVLLAAQPDLITPVLLVSQRVITRNLPDDVGSAPTKSSVVPSR